MVSKQPRWRATKSVATGIVEKWPQGFMAGGSHQVLVTRLVVLVDGSFPLPMIL
jgi:hypothetical protein